MPDELRAIQVLLLAGLFAVLATLIGAPLLVARFRRRVGESMNRSSPENLPSGPEPTPLPGANPLPRIDSLDALTADERVAARIADADRRRRRIALAYAAGGVAHALLITGFALVAYDGALHSVAAALAFLLVFLLPLAPTLAHLLTASASRTGMATALVAGLAAWLAGDAAGLLGAVAALHLLLPGVLFGLLLLRRWRALAPLLLPLGFAVGLGWMLGFTAARVLELPALLWPLRLAGMALGFGLAASGLRRMAQAYRAKRVSDQELFIDSAWLFYTGVQAVVLAIKAGPWMLASLAAFAVFRGVRRALLRDPLAGSEPCDLLLLRVFGHDARTEELLDALTLRWRAIGTVQLIAGTDLATRNLDPHELYAFVGGAMDREFVRGDADLQARVAAIDRGRDPDGRFRITQFYCHRDTWQGAVDRLIAGAGAVLMDLRGLTRERRGCQYELARLAGHRGEKPMVLLIDRHTDLPLVHAAFGGGAGAGEPPTCLLDADALGGKTLEAATRLLLGERQRR